MKINKYLSPYGGGDCGDPNGPCQGPDCPGTGGGCEPYCDPEPCPDGSWPPCPGPGPCTEPCPNNNCTGPCCVNETCICDDCSYGDDGDWHVYWSCLSESEVIILDSSMSSITNDDLFKSQNSHFDVTQINLGRDIEIGDSFCGIPCQDGIIPGVDYPEDCYTYLGKKYGSSPATAVANGLTVPEGFWAGISPVNEVQYDLSFANCDTCSEDPEQPSESGCMDPVACNYNPLATGISVNCCYNEGCTDSLALNYEIGTCCDDGSCCYVGGCTDETACNWDHGTSCIDDGSCCYVSGCMDAIAFNYNYEACCDDGSCCYTSGCTDPTATNYDPAACFDDGSCEGCTSSEVNSCETKGTTNMNEFWTALEIGQYYPIIQPYMPHLNWFINPTNYQTPFASKFFELDTGESNFCGNNPNICEGPNSGQLVTINSYICEFTHENGGTGSQIVNSWDEAITFWNNNGVNLNQNMSWTAVQSLLNGTFVNTQLSNPPGWQIRIHETECCDCTSSSTCGCTDPTATNYDPNATFDDGSCTYCGCTDEACGNYDPLATCDDGSCNCGGDSGGCTDDRALNYDPTETITNNDLCEWEVPLYCTYNLDTGVLTTPSWICVNPNSNSIYDWVTHLNDTHSVQFGGWSYGTSFDVGHGTQYAEEICATYLGKFKHTGDPDDDASHLISTVGINGAYILPNANVLNQASCIACAEDPLLPDSD